MRKTTEVTSSTSVWTQPSSRRRLGISLVLMAVLMLSLSIGTGWRTAGPAVRSGAPAEQSWIIKWKQTPDNRLLACSTVLQQDRQLHIAIAKPPQGMALQRWLHAVHQDRSVQYIEQNETVHASSAAAVNDPDYKKQSYLQQIHAPQAWKLLHAAKSTDPSGSANAAGSASSTGSTHPIIIASVDTGVDLKHPDLKGRLVKGYNLIDPSQPPQDDNGHGTEVAGVIAAAADNGQGVAGIDWKAKIMPIKALDADGTGSEAMTVEGIRYAVDHHANIIDLSLGLVYYTKTMRDAVQYAEDHGVLVVAAAGNEGNSIQYPAAYPSVMAVGGLLPGNQMEHQSNEGPELDIVAPWEVYTTTLGGGYDTVDGTSMAAPQVAAAAGLIMARYPKLSLDQVKNLIRQSTVDLGSKGWDRQTGYGLLQIDKALSMKYQQDFYEPDNTSEQAAALPEHATTYASLSQGSDVDWYYIDSSYDGTLQIHIKNNLQSGQLLLKWYDDFYSRSKDYFVKSGDTLKIPVTKGRSYIELMQLNPKSTIVVDYRLTTGFQIAPDAYEPNDLQYEANSLPARNQTVIGNFDHYADQDWYEMRIPKAGAVHVRLSADTERIDPNLSIVQPGGDPVQMTTQKDGFPAGTFHVMPGTYYFHVSNNEKYTHPVVGQYKLDIQYRLKYTDVNEPNDTADQATMLKAGTAQQGLFQSKDDVDWFTFNLKQQKKVRLLLSNVPAEPTVSLSLLDKQKKIIDSSKAGKGKASASLSKALKPGIYYVKLKTNQHFDYQKYTVQLSESALGGNYKDVSGNWAKPAIEEITKAQIMNGYSNQMFYPSRAVTRREAAVVLSRAFHLSASGKTIYYKDVSSKDWAYSDIEDVTEAGFMQGFPGNDFKPDQPLTRMEFTSMLANILQISAVEPAAQPFADVPVSYWGAGVLNAMKKAGWVNGYPDGTFKPAQGTSRAQLAFLMMKIIHLKE